MPARASILTLLATLAVALGAIGLAIAEPGQPRPVVAFEASGALGLTSSRDGQTLFSAGAMRPGGAVSGTLRVTNTGAAPEILALRLNGIHDQAGVGGGVLSSRLALTVTDVSASGHPVQLWAGRPPDLAEARLAVLPARAARDLMVTAALPASGAGNAYQGASVSFGLIWGVLPVSAPPTATPAPARTPAPVVATPAPPPVTAPLPPVPTPAAVTADELGLPSATACISRRSFAIHLRAPRGGRVTTAVVKVGSTRALKLRGHGKRVVSAKVNLRGFRQRTVTVKIALRTTDGHRYRAKRTYHICAGR
jgi:hypothetical protein